MSELKRFGVSIEENLLKNFDSQMKIFMIIVQKQSEI